MYIIQQGNTAIVADRVEMFIPDGGAHVRQCYIQVPYGFKGRPVVLVTIQSVDSPGNALTVWSIEDASSTATNTIFKVSATNVEGRYDIPYTYWCDFTMMGELAGETAL